MALVKFGKDGKSETVRAPAIWNRTKKVWEQMGDSTTCTVGKTGVKYPCQLQGKIDLKTGAPLESVQPDGTWKYSMEARTVNENKKLLKQKILNEIKGMLKEEFGFSDLFGGSPGSLEQPTRHTSKYSTCEYELLEMYGVSSLRGAKDLAIEDIMKSGKSKIEAQKILERDMTIPTYVTTNDYSEQRKYCLKELKSLGKTPKPPRPQTCPDGTPAPDGDVSKCKVSPTPKPELKGSGCKPGSKFIGKNGATSGPEVVALQQILTSAMLTGGKSLPQGIFDPKTEEAVLNFQNNYGAKYAQKVKSELGRDFPLDKTDGCVGPKTACALLLYSKVDATIAGFNKAKCKARFGKAIEQGAIKESKNWLDRTREDTTSSLFERLVKDVSNKKVI